MASAETSTTTSLAKRRLWGAIRIAFVAAVVVWLVAVAGAHAHQLRQVHLRLNLWLFAVAAPATLSGGLLLALAWRALMDAYGTTLSPLAAIRIWTLASASRYLPTGVFAVASRAVLAAKLGASRALTVWSAVVEFGVLVVSGAVLAAVLLPSHVLTLPVRYAGAAGGITALTVLPMVLDHLGRGARWAGRMANADVSSLRAPRPRLVYGSVGLYCLNSVMRSVGSVLVVAAIVPLHASAVWLVAGSTNAAAVAGLIGITPAGIGVREAVLTTLLQPHFGLGDAATIAIVLRAWDFVCDLVWISVALALPPLAKEGQ